MSPDSSDLYLFATTLAGDLGWTASLVPDTQRTDLKTSSPNPLLDNLLADEENPAALLTLPSGTQLMAVPAFDDFEPGVYAIGPRLPDDLPRSRIFADSPHSPDALAMIAAADDHPDYTADAVRHFAHEWEDHFFLLRNPREQERRDHVFTAYTETLAASLPGEWTTTLIPLVTSEREALRDTLWTSGPDTATMLSRRAARAVFLSGPDHDVAIVQEAGSRSLIIAATFLPASPRITPGDPIPGPAPLVLPDDPSAAAERIRTGLLPFWDRAVWDTRIGLVAHASVELHQALDTWHAVALSYTGHPLALAARATGESLRNSRARDAVDVYLAHAPALLDGIIANTHSADHFSGQLRDDLRELDNVRRRLTGAARIRKALAEVQRAPVREQPFLARERMHQLWDHAAGLAVPGDAMIRAARTVSYRIGKFPPPPEDLPARRPTPAPVPPAPLTAISPTRRGR